MAPKVKRERKGQPAANATTVSPAKTPLKRQPPANDTTVSPAKRLKGGVFVPNSPGNIGSAGVMAHVARNKHFAEGAFRYVYRGKFTTGPRAGEACVAKEFKTGCVYEETFFQDDIKAVQKAGEIIKDFNECSGISKPIYINEPEVWTYAQGSSWVGQKTLVEPMIAGEYFKFNSNTGYAAPDADAMQALSHFSYHHSQGKTLLCDLQGGRFSDSYVLTDPVILSEKKEYGATDLGQEGISNFMAYHKCGRFCNPKWKRPAAKDLVPTFKAVDGTTFGSGTKLWSNTEIRRVQDEMEKCWQKHLPVKTFGK